MHNISESTDAFYILLAISILSLVAIIALCFLMAAVLKTLTNQSSLTPDDPTGERKQKIFDTLTKVNDGIKTIV